VGVQQADRQGQRRRLPGPADRAAAGLQAARPERAQERPGSVSQEKKGAAPGGGRGQGRQGRHQGSEGAGAERDQGGVRQGAQPGHQEDLGPGQTLAQDEGVLGADGDDQAGAEGKTLGRGQGRIHDLKAGLCSGTLRGPAQHRGPT
jgi:hypothetical protein